MSLGLNDSHHSDSNWPFGSQFKIKKENKPPNPYSSAFSTDNKELTVSFACDIIDMLVDGGLNKSVTNDKQDFMPGTYIQQSGGTLHGVGAEFPVPGFGTVQWTIENNGGTTHNITIDNVLYCPKVHCGFSVHNNSERNSGTLQWDQKEHGSIQEVENPFSNGTKG